MQSQIKLWAQLTRLDRLVGVWLLLWPALAGLFLGASGWPSLKLILIFTLGTILMRSAGCVLNDFADRDIDGKVKRTSSRPLASGFLRAKSAIIGATIISLLAACLLFYLNTLTIICAVIGFILAVIYPWSKRWCVCPQAILGLAFAWPVVMGFAATTDSIPVVAWLWFLGVWCWVVAYDTQYAMVDRDDDKNLGIHSSALWFGNKDRMALIVLHVVACAAWGIAAASMSLSPWFFIGLAIVFILFLQQTKMTWSRTREQCWRAFKHNIYAGAAWFSAVMLGLFLPH